MDTAKYTVNEVEERTQVPAGTLRQWERRYGFPMPERSQSGYRLYSESDIDHIEAMKGFIADGIPASRAAELVRNRPPTSGGRAPSELRDVLVHALLDYDEATADQVLSEGYSFHPVETVVLQIMRDAVVEIGDLWHSGEITVANEHFASNYLIGRLRSLMSLSSLNRGRQSRTALVACAPLDQHELGALMLSVLLRRSGFRVVYIGANTPIEDLAATAAELRPDAVVIAATNSQSLELLAEQRDAFRDMAPLVAFGGPAFSRDPERATALGGYFLSEDIETAAQRLERILDGSEAA